MSIIGPVDSIPVVGLCMKKGNLKLVSNAYGNKSYVDNKNYRDLDTAIVAKIFANQRDLCFVEYTKPFISIGRVLGESKLYFTAVKIIFGNGNITKLADYEDLASAYIDCIEYAIENDLAFTPFWLLGKSFKA
jgi:hypothetical protein